MKIYIFTFKDGHKCLGKIHSNGDCFDLEGFMLDNEKIVWCDEY